MNAGGGENGAGAPDAAAVRGAADAIVGITAIESNRDASGGAIDARGAGEGTEEVAAERPRWYYITVESANVDWKVSVDERLDAVRK